MFNKLIKNKRVLVALAAVAALAVAGIAYGYLTTTGSGGGSGNVTAINSTLSLSVAQPDLTALGQTQSVAISATNTNTNGQAEYFSGISSMSVATSAAALANKCPTGSFTLDTPSTTAQDIPADSKAHQVGTVNVTFVDLASEAQNGCLLASSQPAVSYSENSN
jgi:hypothetical protein